MTEVSAAYSLQIISTFNSLENQLENISKSQTELMDAISKAQETSVTPEELSNIKKMMDKVALYNTKLLSLKATMSMLTGRSKQLLGKASKLKQMKLQYLSQIDSIRQIEQEKDEAIAAKHSLSSPIIPSRSSPAVINKSVVPATTTSSTTSIPKIINKKKKKTKAREVLIGDDDDTSNWAPKQTLTKK